VKAQAGSTKRQRILDSPKGRKDASPTNPKANQPKEKKEQSGFSKGRGLENPEDQPKIEKEQSQSIKGRDRKKSRSKISYWKRQSNLKQPKGRGIENPDQPKDEKEQSRSSKRQRN
jgi:hypothetical protein